MTEPMATPTQKAEMLLRDALLEAQATVRSYDVKAQIVGVGYIFALGVVGSLDALLPEVERIGPESVVLTWAIVMSPIILFGYVL